MVDIRWTIGDVSPRGFEPLRLRGAGRNAGAVADNCVSADTVSLDRACHLEGPGSDIAWHANVVIRWQGLDALGEELPIDLGQFASVCRGCPLKTGSRGLPALSMEGG
jgi:hypothetical protein